MRAHEGQAAAAGAAGGGAGPASVELIEMVSASAPNASDRVIAFADTPTAGQLMVVLVFSDAGTTALTPPSGWNELFNAQANTTREHWIFWRTADGSESNSYTWSGSSLIARGWIFEAGAEIGAAGTFGTHTAAPGSSPFDTSSADVAVPDGSYGIVGVSFAFARSDYALTEGHTYSAASTRAGYGHRAYPTAEPTANPQFSWTGTANTIGCSFTTVYPA